jgi:hypothetical protein
LAPSSPASVMAPALLLHPQLLQQSPLQQSLLLLLNP